PYLLSHQPYRPIPRTYEGLVSLFVRLSIQGLPCNKLPRPLKAFPLDSFLYLILPLRMGYKRSSVSYQLQSTLRLACFLPNVLVNESDVLPNNHLKHGFINHTDHSSVCVMFLIKCIISSRTTAQITIDRAGSFQTNNNANKRNTKLKSLYFASIP